MENLERLVEKYKEHTVKQVPLEEFARKYEIRWMRFPPITMPLEVPFVMPKVDLPELPVKPAVKFPPLTPEEKTRIEEYKKFREVYPIKTFPPLEFGTEEDVITAQVREKLEAKKAWDTAKSIYLEEIKEPFRFTRFMRELIVPPNIGRFIRAKFRKEEISPFIEDEAGREAITWIATVGFLPAVTRLLRPLGEPIKKAGEKVVDKTIQVIKDLTPTFWKAGKVTAEFITEKVYPLSRNAWIWFWHKVSPITYIRRWEKGHIKTETSIMMNREGLRRGAKSVVTHKKLSPEEALKLKGQGIKVIESEYIDPETGLKKILSFHPQSKVTDMPYPKDLLTTMKYPSETKIIKPPLKPVTEKVFSEKVSRFSQMVDKFSALRIKVEEGILDHWKLGGKEIFLRFLKGEFSTPDDLIEKLPPPLVSKIRLLTKYDEILQRQQSEIINDTLHFILKGWEVDRLPVSQVQSIKKSLLGDFLPPYQGLGQLVRQYVPESKFYATWKYIIGGLLSSVDSSFRSLGRPGEKIADAIQMARIDATVDSSKAINRVMNAINGKIQVGDRLVFEKGLKIETLDELDALVRFLDKGDTNVPYKVTYVGNIIRDELNKVAELHKRVGTKIRNPITGMTYDFIPRKDYYPHIFPDELIGNRKWEDTIIDRIAKQYKLPKEQAKNFYEKILKQHRDFHYGNIDFSRIVDMPDWIADPRVALPQYFKNSYELAYRRLYWGSQGKILKEYTEGLIRKEDRDMANWMIKAIIGERDIDEAKFVGEKLARLIINFEVATKMWLSAIVNMNQVNNISIRTGFMNTAKAYYNLFRESPALARTYTTFVDEIGKFTYSKTGLMGKWADTTLRGGGFKVSEDILRLGASVAGRNFYKDEFNKALASFLKYGETKHLKHLELFKKIGIDDINQYLRKGNRALSEYHLDRAEVVVRIETEFLSDVPDLPIFWSSPWGRVFSLFKSFTFNQSKFLKDIIFKELFEYGNPMPLIRLLGVFPITGEITATVRSLFSPKMKERRQAMTDLERLVDNYIFSGSVGMLGDIIHSARFGEVPYAYHLSSPAVTDLFKISQGVFKGDIEPITKFTLDGLKALGTTHLAKKGLEALKPIKPPVLIRPPQLPIVPP